MRFDTQALTEGEREIMTDLAREILVDFGPDVDDPEEMELEDILDALEP